MLLIFSASRYQSLDSKRVVSTGGQGGSLEQTKGKDEGMWRRWKREERERERRQREHWGREGERACVPLCASVHQCLLEEGLQRASRAKAASLFHFFFFFSPTKAPLALDPPPLLSDYSSVSPQRQQPGLLDSVGHRWHEYFCCIRDVRCRCLASASAVIERMIPPEASPQSLLAALSAAFTDCTAAVRCRY